MRTRNNATRRTPAEKAVYELAAIACRAGAIGDYFFGRRAVDDDTVIWLVDGVEYERADREAVVDDIEAALDEAEILHVETGPAWCGYSELRIVYADARMLIENYNGSHVVRSLVDAREVAA